MRLAFGPTQALDGVTVGIATGGVTAVTGSSGSGKSTLLYCLAGLLRPDSGEVTFRGRDLTAMTDDERSDLRRSSFGFVFQSAELVPELTLGENIVLPMELNRVPRAQRRQRLSELSERLGLTKQISRRPSQVSGGQAQRAAVARAIAHRPAVVFADEPTGALDTRNGQVVLASLIDLTREDLTAVVLVTHDPTIAAAADRIISMRDGDVVRETC